jgi:hypothetical protein
MPAVPKRVVRFVVANEWLDVADVERARRAVPELAISSKEPAGMPAVRKACGAICGGGVNGWI